MFLPVNIKRFDSEALAEVQTDQAAFTTTALDGDFGLESEGSNPWRQTISQITKWMQIAVGGFSVTVTIAFLVPVVVMLILVFLRCRNIRPVTSPLEILVAQKVQYKTSQNHVTGDKYSRLLQDGETKGDDENLNEMC